jgi:hypothetical protein
MDGHAAAGAQVLDAVVKPRSASALQPLDSIAMQAFDLAEAQPERQTPNLVRPERSRRALL